MKKRKFIKVIPAAAPASIADNHFSEGLSASNLANPMSPESEMPNLTVAEEVEMDAPFDSNPSARDSLTNKNVLTYGTDPDVHEVPLKTLRITNNTAGTVYPILRDPNSNTLENNEEVGLYDPYDAPNKEYRGYIGYEANGKYYFGLKAGESILVNIPLVFWNGARIGIGTDNKYLVPAAGDPNPLRYDTNSKRVIVKSAENSTDTITNGVVMWYRAEVSQAPNDDTEDQLAEWTIRDHVYLSKIMAKTNNEIPDNQLVTLINYDVSNVDNLYLPLAMQALDVWVVPQRTGEKGNLKEWTSGSNPEAYGWTGATTTPQDLQEKIRQFTAPENELLGQYFEGHGWPFYNIPNPNNDPNMPIKIPSGANIFAQSPIKGTRSSYGDGTWQHDKYMLSSGGTDPVMINIGASPFKINIGSEGQASTGNILTLNSVDPTTKEKANSLKKGMSVKCNVPQGKPNPIQPGTKILDVYVSTSPPLYTIKLDKDLVASQEGCNFDFFWSFEDAKGALMFSPEDPATEERVKNLFEGMSVVGHPNTDRSNPIQQGTKILEVHVSTSLLDPHTIKLDKDLVASQDECNFDFVRPVTDYASNAMIRLWYSWAEYYRKHWWKDKNTPAPTEEKEVRGSMQLRTATLSFGEEHPELVEGMAVKGPGLDDAMTEKDIHQGDALILKIASDKKSVILSQVANKASTNVKFTFSPPKELLYTPASVNDPGYPLFSNQLTFTNEPDCRNPYDFAQKVYMIMASMNQIGKTNNDTVCKFMQNIVGANMGYIFNQPAKDSDDGKMLQAMIRDMIKSVLRGVTDFTKYPDLVDAQGKHTQWYPDPAEPHGGQAFNVFNLDPFVWFVHTILGFSGYGFSVDDDTADIGAGGANHLQLSVGGEGGLQKKIPWTIQAPFGPVENINCYYSGPGKGATLYQDIKDVSNTTPIKITTKEPHYLANGDTVNIDQVIGVQAAIGTFKIGNVTKDTFELFDPVTGKNPIASGDGNYNSKPTPGRWSYPPHPYIETGADLTKVFYRVSGDDSLGTFQGTFVSADDLAKTAENGEKFRVWRLGLQEKGQLLLNTALLKNDGTALPEGSYSFTFLGP